MTQDGTGQGLRALARQALSPRMLLHLDPREIRRCLPEDTTLFDHPGFFRRGDWDLGLGSIETVEPGITETVARLMRGEPPEATPQYRGMREAVEALREGRSDGAAAGAYGCRSPADVDRYFRELVAAIEGIRSGGYKTQRELRRAGGTSRGAGDEIQVYLDRTGAPVLGFGGTHRTLICQTLGLARIPVMLMGAHPGLRRPGFLLRLAWLRLVPPARRDLAALLGRRGG